MRRSPSESSFWAVPGWGTQLPPLQARANEATERLTGPLREVFAGVVQSTWNRHRLSEFAPMLSIGFGAPAGGGVAPSRSPGSRDPYVLLSWKHCWVAERPASILARS